MAQCQVCKTSGGNLRRCRKCGMMWCLPCASSGRGHYPKVRASNVCPYCGDAHSVEVVR